MPFGEISDFEKVETKQQTQKLRNKPQEQKL